MCGRFVTPELAEIERFWHVGRHKIRNPFTGFASARYNVAPQQGNPLNYIPVIRADADGTLELTDVQWWLLPHWSKEPTVKFSTFNARVENVATSASFREPFKRRRCLIPAKGWYEWQARPEGKQPWFFHAPDNALLAFAGLWDRWARDGQQIESCTIIVGEADPSMHDVHNRAPFIISREAEAAWLNPELNDPEKVRELLVPASASEIVRHSVSRAVSDARNHGAELIAPIVEI